MALNKPPEAASYSQTFQVFSSAEPSSASGVELKSPKGQMIQHETPHFLEEEAQVDLAALCRDWYKELRQVLDQPAVTPVALHERQVALSILSRQFAQSCLPIANTIVQELELAPSLRTIKPANIGGVAGGTKFRVGNVLFKFAVDNPEEPLYGNNPAQAAKAAKAEQRGLQAVVSSAIEYLGFPLQCLIDFGVHRMTAMCLLPIDSSSLVYGSNNRGVTVHDDDAHVRQLLCRLADDLNLASHPVGDKHLVLAGDVEGHLGKDHNALILDTARMWPPEAPSMTMLGVMFVPGQQPRDVLLDSHASLGQASMLLAAALLDIEMHQPAVGVLASHLQLQTVTGDHPGSIVIVPNNLPLPPPKCAGAPNEWAAACLGSGHEHLKGPILLVNVPPEGSHLTQLLHSNAVKAHPTPLSADAFTGWGAQQSTQFNTQVQLATDRVYTHSLPRLAAQLIAQASGFTLLPRGFVRPHRAAAHEELGQKATAPSDEALTDTDLEEYAFKSGVLGMKPQREVELSMGPHCWEDTTSPATSKAQLSLQTIAGENDTSPRMMACCSQVCFEVALSEPGGALFTALEQAGLAYADVLDWKRHLHSYGCNTRHLGRLVLLIRSMLRQHDELVQQLPHCSQDTLHCLLASLQAYAVARVCKLQIWQQFHRAQASHSAASRRSHVEQFINECLPLSSTSAAASVDEGLPRWLAAKYPGLMVAESWLTVREHGLWTTMALKWKLHALGHLCRLVGADAEIRASSGQAEDAMHVHVKTLSPRVSLLLGFSPRDKDTTVHSTACSTPEKAEAAIAAATQEVLRLKQKANTASAQRASAQCRLAYLLLASIRPGSCVTPGVVRGLWRAGLESLKELASRDFANATQCFYPYRLGGFRILPDSLHSVPHGNAPGALLSCAASSMAETIRNRERQSDILSIDEAARELVSGTFAMQTWAESLRCSIVMQQATGAHDPAFVVFIQEAIDALEEAFVGLQSARESLLDCWDWYVSLPGASQSSQAGSACMAMWLLARRIETTALHCAYQQLKIALVAQSLHRRHARLGATNAAMSTCISIMKRISALRTSSQTSMEELLPQLKMLSRDPSRASMPVWLNLAGVTETSGSGQVALVNDDLHQAITGTDLEFLCGQQTDPMCIILDGFPKHSGRGSVGEGPEASLDVTATQPCSRSAELMAHKAALELALGRPANALAVSNQAQRRANNVSSIASRDRYGSAAIHSASAIIAQATLSALAPPTLPPDTVGCLIVEAVHQGLPAARWSGGGLALLHAASCASFVDGPASGAMHATSPISLMLVGIFPKRDHLLDCVGQYKVPESGGGYFTGAGVQHAWARSLQATRGMVQSHGPSHPLCCDFYIQNAETALCCCRWQSCLKFACLALELRLKMGIESDNAGLTADAVGVSSALACIAACAFHASNPVLGEACALLSAEAAWRGGCFSALGAILQLLRDKAGHAWSVPADQSLHHLHQISADALSSCFSMNIKSGNFSQLQFACFVRAVELLLCHSGAPGNWGSHSSSTCLPCLAEPQESNVSALELLAHTGLAKFAMSLHDGEGLIPQGVLGYDLSQFQQSGQHIKIDTQSMDWDPVGMVRLCWFAFQCGWFDLSELLAAACAGRLAGTLPIGRSGETADSAIVQAAVIRGCHHMEEASKKCGEHLDQLLFLGFSRMDCARALMRTRRVSLCGTAPWQVEALFQQLQGDAVGHESFARVFDESFCLDAASEWLLDEDGRCSMEQASRAAHVDAWKQLLQLGGLAHATVDEVLVASHRVIASADLRSSSNRPPRDAEASSSPARAELLVCPPTSQSVVTKTDIDARDAISSIFNGLYPSQPDCVEYTALTKFWQGGGDPLDFVGVYAHPGNPAERVPPHWHYISYGLSDLYGDRRSHRKHAPVAGRSGFGMEFTMRIAREHDDDAMPPAFPAQIMNTLARYIHASGALIQEREFVQDGCHGSVDKAQARQVHPPDEVARLSSHDANRNDMLLFASKPHCIAARDPYCPPVLTRSGMVRFVQLVPVTQQELEAGRMWNMQGLLDILKLPFSGGAQDRLLACSPPMDALRDASGAFLPGPLLVTDVRRYMSPLSYNAEAKLKFEQGVQVDGSAAAEVTACFCWLPQIPDMPLRVACQLADAGTALPAACVFLDAPMLGQLHQALGTRLPFGRPFMFQGAHTSVNQAKDPSVATQQSQAHLGGWGTKKQILTLTTHGADTERIPQVATPAAPFVVLSPGHLQVHLSTQQANDMRSTIERLHLVDEQAPLPMVLSWPESVPGLCLYIVNSEELVWPRVAEMVLDTERSIPPSAN